MSRPRKPTRYTLLSHPAVPSDLAVLAGYGPEIVSAARRALDDLAHGRVTGKALGERHVSGNLTGLASVKFDLPGSPTRRFRLVYAEIDALTRGVLAIGVREEHAIYRLAVRRIRDREEPDADGDEQDRPVSP